MHSYVVRVPLITLALALLAGAAPAQETDAGWPLAVRFRSYGDYNEATWTHLPRLGLGHVFMSVPAPEDVAETQAKLAEHGLKPVVMRGDADLSKDTFVEEITPQLAICKKLDVKYMFLSAKRGESPKEVAYARLRAAGDAAKAHGVIIAMETHPDLGTNGNVQLETMRAVNHPNVRVNFDTANITYYNKNTSAVAELAKIIDYVATIEFKDHSGEFETWDFPVLGQGVVDFPKIVRMLKDHGYQGPVTIEFEGTKGITLDETEQKLAIAESVAYARSLAQFR